MLVPAGAESFAEALRIGAETYHHLKAAARRARASPRASATRAASRPISARRTTRARRSSRPPTGRDTRDRVALALDPATSELHHDGAYRLERQGGTLDTAGMIDLWADLCDRFPIVSIEDGLGESDWPGWQTLTDRLGGRVQLVGDDLFVTNVDFLRRGIERARRQRDPRQGQPDRHPHRVAGRGRARAPGTATARSSRTARARPRTRRSPTSPSPRTPARSRPARRRARIASRSTTSSSGSRRSWATRPSTRVGRAFPRRST